MAVTRIPIVLLVDDDPGDQELTRRAMIEAAVRVELRIVDDGEQALSYLRREGCFSEADAAPRPDLVLLDLNMPRIDGREVLRVMRSETALRTIPVVVLTTSEREEDVLRSYELGCNTLLRKPVEVDQFAKAIQQVGLYWFEIAQLPSR